MAMINDVVNNGSLSQSSTLSGPTAGSMKQVAPATTTQKAAEPSAEQLDNAVSKLNEYLQDVQRNLSFSIDKETGITVIKVIDSSTQEVVRQLPPDETLKLAAAIDKQIEAHLVQERA